MRKRTRTKTTVTTIRLIVLSGDDGVAHTLHGHAGVSL